VTESSASRIEAPAGAEIASAAGVGPADPAGVPAPAARAGRFQVTRVALRMWRTRIGLAIVVGIVLIAVVGPFVAPHSPTAFVAPAYAHSSGKAPFGTDGLGRDVLSRFLHGGYVILILSATATAVGIGLGSVLGVLAGYLRGFWDAAIMRSWDVVLCFPTVVLALMLVSVSGPKLWLVVLAVGLTQAAMVARVMRGAVAQLVGREFVTYAEALGVSRARLLRQELLPNLTGPLMVQVGFGLTFSVSVVASLAFLGFGVQQPTADWGLMINENQSGLTTQPLPVLLPVLAIALLTIGTSLVADGLAFAAAGIDRALDTAEES
jgi:peptide/nickel transport system permease protein